MKITQKKNIQKITIEEIDDFIGIFTETEYILELSDENMRETTINKTFFIILFYNRFYEKCKDFIPKYINVAKKYIFEGLNGERNFETVIFNSINDYPSFYYFIN